MAISSSFRLFSAKIPQSLHLPCLSISKTLIPSTSILPTFSFLRPISISFQRLPTKPSSASSSFPASASLEPVEDLPPKLQEIVKLFQAVEEPKAKYQQLLFYGKNLTPLDARYKTAKNKVQGCVSQVWVRAYLDSDGNVVFEADSDSVLTKGLAALLVLGLSGRPVDEIVRVSPDFAVLLGLQQSLTPSRNNGFLNMLKLMQQKALELYLEPERLGDSEMGEAGSNSTDENPVDGLNSSSESGGSGTEDSGASLSSDSTETALGGRGWRIKEMGEAGSNSTDEDPVDDPNSSSESDGSGTEDSVAGLGSDSTETALGSRGRRIKEILQNALNPVELQVEDVSYQHAGHAGVKGRNGETHFNLNVVSEEFEGKSLVKRHRIIHNLLQEELQNGLHALSMVTKTPSEVSSR